MVILRQLVDAKYPNFFSCQMVQDFHRPQLFLSRFPLFSIVVERCYNNQLSQGGIAISHEDSAASCISFTWLIAYVVVVNYAGIVSSQGVFTTFGNYISRLRETICSMGSKKTHWGTAATIHLKSPIGLLAQANVSGIMPNLEQNSEQIATKSRCFCPRVVISSSKYSNFTEEIIFL